MKLPSALLSLVLATPLLASPVNVKAARHASPISLDGFANTLSGIVKDVTKTADGVVKAVDGTGFEGITIGGIGTGKRDSELTSRNPAAAATSELTELDKRLFVLPILGPLCVPVCTLLDSVCQVVGVTVATIFNGEFDPIDQAVCIPTYCNCQQECGLEADEIDYFCYEANGGPLPDQFENCDEYCCEEGCPKRDEDGFICSDNERFLQLPCSSDGQ